jgi:hypothetical protein
VPDSVFTASQLRHLLADPEMTALIQAAPQAGRLLRPLCRNLGVELPPCLQPPPRPPRPARAAPSSLPKPRAKKLSRKRWGPGLPWLLRVPPRPRTPIMFQ